MKEFLSVLSLIVFFVGLIAAVFAALFFLSAEIYINPEPWPDSLQILAVFILFIGAAVSQLIGVTYFISQYSAWTVVAIYFVPWFLAACFVVPRLIRARANRKWADA